MQQPSSYAFYSWQSDLPPAYNRTFIENALDLALDEINAQATLEPSPREVALEKDTKGVAGSPVITETIVKKIRGCAVFIGDLTFVGQSLPGTQKPGKPLRYYPNPNVLIEYTHALDFRGDERVIAVVNEAFGGKLESNIPFNLRHRRWPIRYNYGPETAATEKKTIQRRLVADLVAAISLVLREPTVAQATTPFIGSNFSPQNFSQMAKSHELVIDGPMGNDMEPYVLPERAVISLRLQPTVRVPEFETETDAYQAAVMGHLRPMAAYELSGQSPARNAMGAVAYQAPRDGKLMFLSQLFLAKELYGIDAGAGGGSSWRGADQPHPPFHIERVEESFACTLKNYLQFARDTLKLPPPWRIAAGVYNIMNFTVAGRRCLRNEIHWDATIAPGASVLETLTPFFETLWRKFGAQRSSSASQKLEQMFRELGDSK